MSPAAVYLPPRDRRCSPAATALALLSYLDRAAGPGATPGRCLLCRRRPGQPRRLVPPSPALAAVMTRAITAPICGRCGRATAVKNLLASET